MAKILDVSWAIAPLSLRMLQTNHGVLRTAAEPWRSMLPGAGLLGASRQRYPSGPVTGPDRRRRSLSVQTRGPGGGRALGAAGPLTRQNTPARRPLLVSAALVNAHLAICLSVQLPSSSSWSSSSCGSRVWMDCGHPVVTRPPPSPPRAHGRPSLGPWSARICWLLGVRKRRGGGKRHGMDGIVEEQHGEAGHRMALTGQRDQGAASRDGGIQTEQQASQSSRQDEKARLLILYAMRSLGLGGGALSSGKPGLSCLSAWRWLDGWGSSYFPAHALPLSWRPRCWTGLDWSGLTFSFFPVLPAGPLPRTP